MANAKERNRMKGRRLSLKVVLYHLLVDIIPTLALLALMAFGMAILSEKLSSASSSLVASVATKSTSQNR